MARSAFSPGKTAQRSKETESLFPQNLLNRNLPKETSHTQREPVTLAKNNWDPTVKKKNKKKKPENVNQFPFKAMLWFSPTQADMRLQLSWGPFVPCVGSSGLNRSNHFLSLSPPSGQSERLKEVRGNGGGGRVKCNLNQRHSVG